MLPLDVEEKFMADSEGVLDRKREDRLKHKLQSVERRDRFLVKNRSEDSSVMEEVFDKSTLMVIYSLLNQGVIEQIEGVVRSGKESRIYGGTGSGSRIAIKIYLTTSAEFRQGMIPYIVGDPRFKVVRRDSRSLVYLWAQKEFKNLQKAYESGVRVPKPIHVEKNVLVMEFIGEDGLPAPTLKEKPPDNPSRMYKVLLGYVRVLYLKAKLVHGDLSEYNIMSLNRKPVIFDMSQSISIEHPRAAELLQRDLNNLNSFFKKMGVKVKVLESLYKWIIEK